MVHSYFSTSTVKNKSAILTLSCFSVILISMFLPFYEALRPINLIPADSFIVIKTTEFSTTLSVFEFNGFGSLFALINLPVSGLLVLSHFFFPISRVTAILSTFIFVLSMALLIYGNEVSANGPYEDSMLKGFYLMLICEVTLITQTFTKIVNAPPKDRRSNSNTDLLDL